jgi:voltage-gated potassium channel Kch
MQPKVSWSDRLRYWIDNTFSRGTIALIVWLGILSLVIILSAAAVLTITGFNQEGISDRLTFGEAVWGALMRTFDAGTMGADTGWGFRWVMLFVTIGGILIISTLIGVLTAGVEGKLDELRKGRSRVIEAGHTVILGWSEQVFTLLSELVLANENQKNSCIVVLADKDKVEMEDAIRDRLGQTGKTRIVCRTGVPIEMGDLNIAGLDSARSIVILSPESEDADAEVIKTALAITRRTDRRSQPYHIVAELTNPKNAAVARVVGGDEVEWVLVGDLVARIIAQACRQSGLSVVYSELLDFGGDEIYFTHQAELVGRTYAEALDSYEKNTVMGLAFGGGAVQLNPPMDTVLGAEDWLVVIAADDDQIFYQPNQAAVQTEQIADHHAGSACAESTLVLGWNWRGPTILRELDHYVAADSRALVVAECAGVEDQVRETAAGLKNLIVSARQGEHTDRATLEGLGLGGFDHVILLSYLAEMSAQQADSRTLITLLHLRDIADRQNLRFSVTSEMLDVRNRNLAEVARADDFIVSGRLISLMLAQISENKLLSAVFADLFDPEGSEVYLKPVEEYIKLGRPADFYTLVAAACLCGETAIGYRQAALANNAGKAYGVVLNPAKSAAVDFQPGDKIIVLADK